MDLDVETTLCAYMVGVCSLFLLYCSRETITSIYDTDRYQLEFFRLSFCGILKRQHLQVPGQRFRFLVAFCHVQSFGRFLCFVSYIRKCVTRKKVSLFERCNNVGNFQITLYQRLNNVMCSLGSQKVITLTRHFNVYTTSITFGTTSYQR